MAILRHIRAHKTLNDWLARHAKNVVSQSGEDGILEKIFEVMPEGSKWCVEFGAWDGKHLSNTWNLITNKGWSGVLIEADADKFQRLKGNYSGNPKAILLNEFVEFEGPQSLDELLSRTRIDTEFDLLSIDVDGNDYHIWDSLNRYRPRVVVVEFNPSIPNDTVFVQDRDMAVCQGNSLRALVELGKTKGYELVSTTMFNGVFVRREYFSLFNIEDNDLEKMHDVGGYAASLIQLYDGTLLVSGCNKLIWHGVPISPADIQVLPAALRKYPGQASRQ